MRIDTVSYVGHTQAMITATQHLNETITRYAKRGYVVTATTPDVIVMTRPKNVNHAVHFVLSVLTLGLWLLVWLLVALLAPAHTVTISTRDGRVLDKSFRV